MDDNDDGDLGAFTCWLVAVAGIVIIGAVLAGRIVGATAGSYADWIAATSTAAAFIAASYAGWFAHRALRREQRRDDQRDQEGRRHQAEAIAAWFVEYPADPSARTSASYAFSIANTSNVPVYDVRVQLVLDRRDAGHPVRIPVLEPKAPHERDWPSELTTEIAAWIVGRLGPVARSKMTRTGRIPPERFPRVSMTFRDSAGNQWERHHDGRLELVRQARADFPPRRPRRTHTVTVTRAMPRGDG